MNSSANAATVICRREAERSCAGSPPSRTFESTVRAALRASSGVRSPTLPSLNRRLPTLRPPPPGRYSITQDFAPEGSTRTPKPLRLVSYAMNDLAAGCSESTVRFESFATDIGLSPVNVPMGSVATVSPPKLEILGVSGNRPDRSCGLNQGKVHARKLRYSCGKARPSNSQCVGRGFESLPRHHKNQSV